MRKDGRFVGADGTIPEGQGIIMANLNECHELVGMASHPSLTVQSHCKTNRYPVQLKEAMDEGETEFEDDEEEDDFVYSDDDKD